mgnify:CR=1 FL=1
MPIGFRDAHAAVRSARLALAQSYGVLQDQENKAVRVLTFSYQRLFTNYEQIIAQKAQREAATTQLEARFKGFLAGRVEDLGVVEGQNGHKPSVLRVLRASEERWNQRGRASRMSVGTLAGGPSWRSTPQGRRPAPATPS